MQYPANALDLIEVTLTKAQKLHDSVLADKYGWNATDWAREFLAFMSQFGLRWCGVDPLYYQIETVDRRGQSCEVVFRSSASDHSPKSIRMEVPAEVGDAIWFALAYGPDMESGQEKALKAGVNVREIVVRKFPILAERLKTLQTHLESNSEAVTGEPFERDENYNRFWIYGRELTPSQDQSKFIRALDRVFPEAAKWETIQKMESPFTALKPYEIWRVNEAGPELKKLVLRDGRRYQLKLKTTIRQRGIGSG